MRPVGPPCLIVSLLPLPTYPSSTALQESWRWVGIAELEGTPTSRESRVLCVLCSGGDKTASIGPLGAP